MDTLPELTCSFGFWDAYVDIVNNFSGNWENGIFSLFDYNN